MRVLVAVLLTGCWTSSHPAPEPPAAPEPETSGATMRLRSPVGSLSGQSWYADESNGDNTTWDYRPDGSLHYVSTTGDWTNGSWQQDGTHIMWETNGHYADYVGEIQGDTMSGTASNKAGSTWTWTATRVR